MVRSIASCFTVGSCSPGANAPMATRRLTCSINCRYIGTPLRGSTLNGEGTQFSTSSDALDPRAPAGEDAAVGQRRRYEGSARLDRDVELGLLWAEFRCH